MNAEELAVSQLAVSQKDGWRKIYSTRLACLAQPGGHRTVVGYPGQHKISFL